MPWEAASCLTPCSQVAKSPPHGAALATPAVASQNNKTLDGAPSGRGMMAPRRVAPVAEFNPMPSLRAKHGKVQAQNPVILWLANNGKQSDGRHKYGGRRRGLAEPREVEPLANPWPPHCERGCSLNR